MSDERSLEAILRDLRRKHGAAEASPAPFNQQHRYFLDCLRNWRWVHSSKLPDQPQTKIILLRNEWIERRDTATGAEYRITDAGMDTISDTAKSAGR